MIECITKQEKWHFLDILQTVISRYTMEINCQESLR